MGLYTAGMEEPLDLIGLLEVRGETEERGESIISGTVRQMPLVKTSSSR